MTLCYSCVNLLRTAYCVLRTAYCVLCTVYCVLRTAYWVLRIKVVLKTLFPEPDT